MEMDARAGVRAARRSAPPGVAAPGPSWMEAHVWVDGGLWFHDAPAGRSQVERTWPPCILMTTCECTITSKIKNLIKKINC